MTRHSPPRTPSETASGRVGQRPEDDRLNQRIADAMREAADAREARSHTTSAQDASANGHLQQALRALIDRRPS